jgi:DNA-binding NtrC family response regulator
MMRQTDDASKGPQSKDGLFQARLISISDESLKNAVYQGRFHEELYVRLTGFPIRVPSLRERQQDIPELSRFFVQRFSVREHLSIQNFSDDAQELLTRHTWPDNVIELRHVVFRALMRSEGTRIEAEQVAEAMVEYDPGMPSHIIWSGKWGEMFERMRERSNHFSLILRDGNVRSLAELEEEMIRFAIRHYNGRMTEVAKRLGIGRSTLYRKLQDYNIQDVDAA